MPGRKNREQEQRRLAALKRLAVLDTPREERFDAVTRFLTQEFGVPISMISLVDDERVWFKSEVGLGVEEAPRDIAFCSHALEERGLLVIEDASKDVRFSANPLVTGEVGLRFYAGAVVYSPQRQPLGTVCILDHQPRRMSYCDRKELIDFAAHVGRALSGVESKGGREADMPGP